ncbi:MAG: hypothetical protein DLM73_07650 [Chthoniobacterales bacterium]|nr:MAG: hypothetical protein DLM73_07650 [Chthoniobacterales bacterium]
MTTPIRCSFVAAFVLLLSSIFLPAAKAQVADLAVSKSADVDQAAVGANITYTIQVTNNGPDDSAPAQLTDFLPAGTTFVSLASPPAWFCSTPSVGSSGTVACNNPALVAGTTDTFTLVVKIASGAPGTFITNQATVDSSTDPNDENNSASATTQVTGGTSSDLGVTKEVDADQALAGSNVTYTIQVTNFGADASPDAQLSDSLPSDMTFVSVTQPPGWSCSSPSAGSGGTVVCTNSNFPAGNTSTFTLVGFIPSSASSGSVYNNIAFVSSSTDNSLENNSSVAATTVVAAAPTLSTTVSSSSVVIGGTISDNATLTGGASATGNITFLVYGPDVANCNGAAAFSSTINVNGDGTYDSGPFTPTTAGTYRFVAIYSGDGNNKGTATLCGDANESVVVSKQTAALTTQASASTTLGNSVSDSATLSNAANATGTITFRLFGPNNGACSGAAISTSVRNVNGNGNYNSDPFTPSTSGTYRWVATYSGDVNTTGVVTSCNDSKEAVFVDLASPAISGTASPQNTTVGTPVTDTATLSGGTSPTGAITFTVYGPNPANCASSIATSSKTVTDNGSYASNPFTPAAPGTYYFVASYSGDASNKAVATACGAASQTFVVSQPSPSPTPTPTPTPTPAQSLNISTRGDVQLGDKALIGGFIIKGNANKPVVLRGLGPSLTSFGLSNVLLNPQLELRGSGGNLIFMNKNWKDDQRGLIEGTNFQPSDDRESVIVATLQPGAYTVLLTGEGNTIGTGLVEVYDTNQAADSKLANISSRGFVQTQDKVMIGGFTLGGNNTPTRIAVRGLGPSLSQFGLSPVLADPTLVLRNQNGTIVISNDDWQTDPGAAQLTLNGLAPSNPKEAGIFTTLPPGPYTAILAGQSGGIGIGLLEIYNLQ